jgi:hypothetical protein
MAFTIFMCGHGSYKPNSGYFDLPKGCSLEFVVNHAKLLPTGDMFKICGGTYAAASDRTVGEFGSVPNMSWTADELWKITECKKRLLANPKIKLGAVIFPNDYDPQLDGEQTITLKQWFSNNAEAIRNTVATYGNVLFIWNCCSHIGLKSTSKGAEFGVNAGQSETSYTFLDLTNGIIPTGRVVNR